MRLFLVSASFVLALPGSAAAERTLAPDLASGRVVNRSMTPLADGDRRGVRLDERQGQGIVWIEHVQFATGVVEVDVRGKDVFQRSFVGIAFHGVSDKQYEVVYLRPFLFRTDDSVARQQAIQYAVHPDFTWPKLRAERPGEFEKGVPDAPDPNGWVRLRLEITTDRVRAFVGGNATPALDVPRLGKLTSGEVGLWVGSNSGGDFANLRVEPAR